MPKFLTISPTHIPGMKEYAWKKFLSGGYVAIGWLTDDNLEGKSIDDVISLIRKRGYDNEANAIDAFQKFLKLDIGDYVAVNNVNDGLFGIGIITSPYHFKKGKHDTGAEDQEEFYSHYREAEWKYTNYVKRKDALSAEEVSWRPYGTVGSLQNDVPPYIKRLLGETVRTVSTKASFVIPEDLDPVVRRVFQLQKEAKPSERAHESLVEDFFQAIGYKKDVEIKYRQGRMDISIWEGKSPVLVVEVKRERNLSQYTDNHGARKQAYDYALNHATRYVVVTNGDYYAVYDRLKGLSYSSNLVGEFCLTKLEENDLPIIDRLRRGNLTKINLEELFTHLSESFREWEAEIG